MAHLSLVYSNGLPAVVTVLCEHGVEADQTERLPFPHDVPLATQLLVALEAGKVFHVPGTSLSLCALIGQDNLKGEEEGSLL